MSNARSELRESVQCGATTSLTETETAKLGVVSSNLPAVDDSLHCEIVAGHEGSHIAFATLSEGDEQWWWLCWEGQAREIRQIDLCGAHIVDAPYLDECLLLDGHPGPHSFAINRG